MVALKVGCQKSPHIAGIAKAVKQHDRGALAAHTDMNRSSLGFDVLRAD